jgi:hypothetical protein
MDVRTAHPIVHLVRDAILETTGRSLVGLYLHGSLATGDFEPDVSDIDLIAVLTDVPDASLVSQLRETHAWLAEDHRAWDDRIEVDYVSRRGLAECRTRTTTIARISPASPCISSRRGETSSSTGTRRAATGSRSSDRRSTR